MVCGRGRTVLEKREDLEEREECQRILLEVRARSKPPPPHHPPEGLPSGTARKQPLPGARRPGGEIIVTASRLITGAVGGPFLEGF